MRLIIFILFAVLLFASCQKCQTCEQEIITDVGLNRDRTYVTFDACGSDLRAVKNKTTVATATSNGVTARVTTKTVCY